MKVILNQNVENLGSVGDVVEVRKGYARNFLFPRGCAVEATPTNVRVVSENRANEIAKEKESKAQAETLSKKLQGVTLAFEAETGDEGKLFGSVTVQDIGDLLAAQGFEVDRKSIRIPRPIRKVGSHDIELKLYSGVKCMVRIAVSDKKKEKAEAAAQAKKEKAKAKVKPADAAA